MEEGIKSGPEFLIALEGWESVLTTSVLGRRIREIHFGQDVGPMGTVHFVILTVSSNGRPWH